MSAAMRETMPDHVAAFLEDLRASGSWPRETPDLCSTAGLSGPRPETDSDWDAFGRAFSGAISEYPPHPEEWAHASPGQILGHAEGNVSLGLRYLMRDATCPLVQDRDAVIAEAREADVTWEWTAPGPVEHRALITLARLEFVVCFRRFREDEWSQGWMGYADTADFLDHLDREERMGRRVRTGLFPKIDAAIGEITRDFLETANPAILQVDGIDGRRNAHNVATYGAHAPEGYALEPVRARDATRADAAGHTGVRFVRLDVPGMRP